MAFPWLDLTKLPHLAFKLLDPRLLGGRLAWPFAAITLDLSHPDAKTVRRTAQFTRDRRQRRSFALIIIAVFHRQPHRTFRNSGEYGFEVFFFDVCSITGNSP